MKELTIFKHNGTLVTDSREVAEMVEKDHKNLLADIRGYIAALENSIELKFQPNDFFLESTYQDSIGRTLPCYLLTRKGCDMVANKLTGERGVRFTATYIDRFYEMENALKEPKPLTALEQLQLQVQALQEIEKRQSEQQGAIATMTNRLDNIGEIISLSATAWREESRTLIVRIAQAMGGNDYIRDVNADIYRLILERFSIDVKKRRTNMRLRAAEEGMCKSKREKLSCVDAIALDKKAIEAYLTIIKDMAVKYGLDK